MPSDKQLKAKGPLLMVAGIKGAVGSTLATAVAALKNGAEHAAAGLTTRGKFSYLGPLQDMDVAGWDLQEKPLPEVVRQSGILPENIWKPYLPDLEKVPVLVPPDENLDCKTRVGRLEKDMRFFSDRFSTRSPVLMMWEALGP